VVPPPSEPGDIWPGTSGGPHKLPVPHHRRHPRHCLPYVPHDKRPPLPISNVRRAQLEAEAAEKAKPPRNVWQEFLDKYEGDSELFVREVLGVGPDTFDATGKQTGGIWPNQLGILKAYDKRVRRIAQKSGHRVGKSTVLSWIIVHQAVCRAPQKTVCTATTTKQLFEALYAETVTWFKRLPPAILDNYEIKSEEIVLKAAPQESFVSFRTSSAEKPEALAGVHSKYVLLICDEASGIPEPIFEGAIGSMANPGAIQILAGNPVRRSGLFYDVFHKAALRSMWETSTASCEGHPNVDQEFVLDVKSRYGELSNAYRVRVLGEFPLVDDDAVIPFVLIEAALKRDVTPRRVRPFWGVDPARKGRDMTGFCKRQGNALMEKTREWKKSDTMQTVGLIKTEWDDTPIPLRPEYIFIDSIGIGGPVADRLRELGLPAIDVNVSEAAAMSDRYPNLRSELWFKAKEWLERKDCSLAEDEELAHQLALPNWEPTSAGKHKVEGKKEMMKRTHEPSPNRADAFMMTLIQEAATALGLLNSSTSPVKRNEALQVDLGFLC
jgi:Terminase-like family.